MAAMGALGLGLYRSPPAPSRSFPVYFADGEVVYPDCECLREPSRPSDTFPPCPRLP